VVVDEAHSTEQASKRKEKQAKAAEHAVEFLNIKISDALIALFTIVLAYKTAGLFKETAGLREATDKMYLAGGDQLAVALKAAYAASGSPRHRPPLYNRSKCLKGARGRPCADGGFSANARSEALTTVDGCSAKQAHSAV
jgi:hypothetical protein